MQIDFVFWWVAILIMSVVIHEVSHGYAASMLGDETARYQGRLTLNPLKHLDLFGSIILPLILVLTKAGFIFGWAKPVPYNPYNLRPGRWSEATVAVAGPASNLLIALVFGLVLRSNIFAFLGPAFIEITSAIVFINILLAIFNMVPIPPLDGSKILFALFPDRLVHFRESFERYGIFFVLIFIFFLWRLIFPIIIWLFRLIAGPSAGL